MASRDKPYLAQLFGMMGKIIVGGFTIIFMIMIGGAMLSSGTSEVTDEPDYSFLYGTPGSENQLLKINVSGPILGLPPEGLGGPFGFLSSGGGTYGYAVKDALDKAAKDKAIKGVLIHMATPGGTVFGSMAIYDGIKAYRDATHNPVVVYIEGIAASGGVMAMVGADEIYADAGSLVGSIGVIGGEFYYYNEPMAVDGGLLGGGITTGKGIEQTVVAAGRGKDFGNPFRRVSPEELATWQQSVDSLYREFVTHVAMARGMDETVIVQDMGAQVFGNQQAQDYGLIDGTKSWQGAIEALADLAGVGEDYQLVRPRPTRLSAFERLFVMLNPDQAPLARLERKMLADACIAARLRVLVYFGSPSQLCP